VSIVGERLDTLMTGAVAKCDVTDGLLTVNKEAGWTSHDVVAKVRRLLGGMKVGHAGTLDPAATGLLPVLIGKGTRIAEYLVEWDKEYRAHLRLGVTTDTLDATGAVLERRPTEQLTPDRIRAEVERFRGEIQQVPPMYSAVKIKGVPLYRTARAGKTIARDARTVVIHALDVLGIVGSDVTLRVVCSKGTYIRTLCADIGSALGVGGHLRALERTRVGPLTLNRALTVDEVIDRHTIGGLSAHMWSLDEVLRTFPGLVVDGRAAERVCHGAPVSWSNVVTMADGPGEPQAGPVRIHDAVGRLLAVGRLSEPPFDRIAVEKVFVAESI
jgi:tRNA pseudouridine55 synthase